MRQVFLDTETTGLSAASGDRIVEIGGIEYINRRDSGRRLHHYINPERSSHPDALRVHGITDQFLSDKPLFKALAADIAAFVSGAEVIIHNAAFDCAFLDAEFARAGLPRLNQHAARITDSLLMAREQFPGKANSLDALCKRLEVDNSGRDLHGALLDAGLLAEVYLRMTRGQGTLVIDAGDTKAGRSAAFSQFDLSQFVLLVLKPSPEDCAAHDALLAELQVHSKGKLVWNLPAEPVEMA